MNTHLKYKLDKKFGSLTFGARFYCKSLALLLNFLLKRVSLLMVLFLLVPMISQGQETESFADLIQAFEDKNPGVSFSCSFVDAKSGEESLSYNHRSLVPASIMKVVSGATAMKVLGSEYRFETKLAYTGSVDENGVLKGDVVVVGAGDPTFESSKFGNRMNRSSLFVEEIAKKGIKKIEGQVVIDLSRYGNLNVPGSWLYEDIGNYYGAGPSSLSCFDNLFLVELRTGRVGTLSSVVKTKPAIDEIRIVNFVKASKSNRDNAWIYSAPFSYDQQIRGTIPANRKSFTIKASLPNPPLLFGTTLKTELEAKGISVSKEEVKLRFDNSKKEMTTLYTDRSPTLAEIEEPMLHRSINLIADHLFIESATTTAIQPNFSEAGRWLLSYWRKQGVDVKGNFVEDGSGLSRANAVQSRFVASVLQNAMNDSVVGKPFLDALPQVGVEGTVRYYFKGKPFAKGMRAKTGSMSRVRSLAGTIKSKTEKEYCFCLITNNYSCSRNDLLTFYSKLFEHLYDLY